MVGLCSIRLVGSVIEESIQKFSAVVASIVPNPFPPSQKKKGLSVVAGGWKAGRRLVSSFQPPVVQSPSDYPKLVAGE